MTVRVIAAASRNGVIGVGPDLPWRLREDLRLFKSLTQGRTVVMGRKTYESIGKPLPNRVNVVLSRTMQPTNDIHVIRSLDELTELFKGEVDVIGGGDLYAAALKTGLVDELIITHVECSIGSKNPDSLVFFPFWLTAGYAPATVVATQLQDSHNEHHFCTIKYKRT